MIGSMDWDEERFSPVVSLTSIRFLPALLSPEEVALVLGVDQSESDEWLSQGSAVTYFELGGHRWVRTVELADYVFGIHPSNLIR